MTDYNDYTVESHFGHIVAKWISGSNHRDIALYEFHRAVDPTSIWNCEEGYQAFVKLSKAYYQHILGGVDNTPAVISVAVKLGGEWLICHDCGANYYTGNGPQGILALRKACVGVNAIIIGSDQNMEEWLLERFGPPDDTDATLTARNDTIQFEKLVKSLQSFAADLPRRREAFAELPKEEDLRDVLLPMLNGVFQGRCNGEAKNGKGKTDILVRTEDGRNEHIFELKVWKGVKSINQTVEQLNAYRTWNNDHAGILMLVREKGFSAILIKVEKALKENAKFLSVHVHDRNSFRFKLKYPVDPDKLIEVHLELVPLS